MALSCRFNPYGPLALGILCVILVWNLFLVIAGAVVAAEMPYYYLPDFGNAVGRMDYYGNSTPFTVANVFFWCTIPFLWLIFTTFVLFRTRQHRLRRNWFLAMACYSIVSWIIQFSIEGVCLWSSPWNTIASFCPCGSANFLMGPYSDWTSVMATQLPWVMIPLLFLYIGYLVFGIKAYRNCRSKTVGWVDPIELSYSNTAVLNTYPRDVPEEPDFVHEAPVPDTLPPRYSSGSKKSASSVEKKKIHEL